MDDKNLMESLLQTEKGICDLYLHGTIAVSYTHRDVYKRQVRNAVQKYAPDTNIWR